MNYFAAIYDIAVAVVVVVVVVSVTSIDDVSAVFVLLFNYFLLLSTFAAVNLSDDAVHLFSFRFTTIYTLKNVDVVDYI